MRRCRYRMGGIPRVYMYTDVSFPGSLFRRVLSIVVTAVGVGVVFLGLLLGFSVFGVFVGYY